MYNMYTVHVDRLQKEYLVFSSGDIVGPHQIYQAIVADQLRAQQTDNLCNRDLNTIKFYVYC